MNKKMILRQQLLSLSLALILCVIYNSSSGQNPVFKNYNNKHGLPSSEIYDAVQDSMGYMWFASDRGICRYDGYSFKTFTSSDGLPDNTVFRLTADSNRVWFHTYTAKVGFIQNNKIHEYKNAGIIRNFLNNSVNSLVTIEEDGSVWVNMLVNNTYTILHIDPFGRVDSSFNKLDSDTRRIYITGRDKCLMTGNLERPGVVEIISLKDKKMIARSRAAINIQSLSPIMCRTVNGKRFMWIDNQVFIVKNGFCEPIIQSSGAILSLMVDRQEDVWIGYRHKGIEVYRPKDAVYRLEQKLLEYSSISCIYRDNNSGIWATTLENGIYYLPPRVPQSYTLNDGLPASKALHLRKLDGNIVVILSNYDLAIGNNSSSKFRILRNAGAMSIDVAPGKNGAHYVLSADFHPDLPGREIFISGFGKLMVGNKFIWHIQVDKIWQYSCNGRLIKTIDFSKISVVKVVFELKDGSVLCGTLEGLYHYDGKTIRPVGSDPLLSKRISDIKRLDARHLLVATMGYGLLVIDEKSAEVIARFTEKDVLPSAMCQVVYPENDSVVWLGTNNGLCRISNILAGAKAQFTRLDINDGLVSNEINDLLIEDDTLWVATMNGISLIPVNGFLPSETHKIPVYLEKVMVGPDTVNMLKPLLLPFDQNEMSFYFTGLDFQHADRLLYKYRLLPADKDWNYTSNRAVIYKALASGKYTFELETAGHGHNVNSRKLLYSFEVLRPFWSTWWFVSLISVAIVLGVYFLVQRRVRFVRNQAQLRNDLNMFKEKALRAQMNPHFIYNSLSSIQSYILNNEIQNSVSMLSRFSRLMRLTFSNTSIPLVPLKSDMEALQLYTELENQRFNNKFRFRLDVSPALNMETIRVPPLIIQPFVENALLHGMVNKEESGVVRVSIEQVENCIEVKIHDNGIGRVEAARIRKRKSRFRNMENSGISVTRARIEQLWGKSPDKSCFRIIDLYEGEKAAGTLVSFVLPIV